MKVQMWEYCGIKMWEYCVTIYPMSSIQGIFHRMFFFKFLMILGLYKKIVEVSWSGWRDLDSHSTLDSQTDIYSYNIKELNFYFSLSLDSQTCENGLKSVRKCDYFILIRETFPRFYCRYSRVFL